MISATEAVLAAWILVFLICAVIWISSLYRDVARWQTISVMRGDSLNSVANMLDQAHQYALLVIDSEEQTPQIIALRSVFFAQVTSIQNARKAVFANLADNTLKVEKL